MAVFNLNGRLFNIRGVETENVRSPYLLVDGGTSRLLLAERKRTRRSVSNGLVGDVGRCDAMLCWGR